MFLTPLSRLRVAGRLCRTGAWLILAIGVFVCICLFFAIYSSNGSNSDPSQLLPLLALSGIVVLFIFFFFVFLFAVGALLEYIAAADISMRPISQREPNSQEPNYEHVEIRSLPR